MLYYSLKVYKKGTLCNTLLIVQYVGDVSETCQLRVLSKHNTS